VFVGRSPFTSRGELRGSEREGKSVKKTLQLVKAPRRRRRTTKQVESDAIAIGKSGFSEHRRPLRNRRRQRTLGKPRERPRTEIDDQVDWALFFF
jgi:hypothetical protein